MKKRKLVEVIDVGYQYTTYTEWIEKYFKRYLKHFKEGAECDVNAVYEIIDKAPHAWQFSILYLIQDPNTKQVYIMGEYGIVEV